MGPAVLLTPPSSRESTLANWMGRLRDCVQWPEQGADDSTPVLGHVSADKIKTGLESFREGGFVPKFLLLDDGWQTVCDAYEDRGLHKLSKFCANEKFDHDLTEIVNIVKKEYGVEQFYVWHALLGYWGGLEPDSPDMKKYGVR